jgi:hypothetical protein
MLGTTKTEKAPKVLAQSELAWALIAVFAKYIMPMNKDARMHHLSVCKHDQKP